MMEKIETYIEEKKFAELEDLWFELLDDENIPLKEFFDIADRLKSIKETERAAMLLEILASNFEDSGKTDKAIEVYKYMPYFRENDQKIRKALIRLYKKKYQKNPRIEYYLALSGLDKGEHIFKSIERLEEFLKYDIGKMFYFERYGVGEVISMNPVKKELIIDFEKEKGYFVNFDIAKGLLKEISEDHFLYKKQKSPAEIKQLAKDDPVYLVKFLLQSFEEPLNSSQIKTLLEGIVNGQIDKFWERVRKKLERDENIKIETKGQKFYQFIKDGFDKKELYLELFKKADIDTKYELAEKYSREQPEVFKQIIPYLIKIGNEIYTTNPCLALDILFLCEEHKIEAELNYSVDDLLKYIPYNELALGLKNYEHQKYFLKIIKEKEPKDWQDFFQKLLFTANNSKFLDLVEASLIADGVDLKEVYQTIALMPHRFPVPFQWLLKKMAQGELSQFTTPNHLPRFINSLDSIKGIKSSFLRAFNLERFDEIIKNATESEAKQIKEALARCRVLKDFEKNDYSRIIEFHYPEQRDEEYIYATYETLVRKKQELEHLLNIEIPKNQQEISRAREYGDLRENFEYKAAKERQAQLYQRVQSLEYELQRVKLIDFSRIDTTKVGIGTKVFLKSIANDEVIVYTILGRWDTDLSKNIISNESPIAKDLLLNKRIGDRIEIEGKTFEIIKIQEGVSPLKLNT